MKNFYFCSRSLITTFLLAVAVNVTGEPFQANITNPAADPDSQIVPTGETRGIDSDEHYLSLRKLGYQYLEARQFHQSADVFQQMLSHTRRNAGVWSIEQEEGLELLAQSYVGLRDIRKATSLNTMLYQVAAREYEQDEPEMHLARLKLGDWYRDTMRYDEAMAQYKASRLLLNEQKHSHLLVGLLRREALALYLSERCCAAEKLDQIQALMQQEIAYDLSDHRNARLAHADMTIIERKRRGPAPHGDLKLIHHTDSPPRLLGLKRFSDTMTATQPNRHNPVAQTYTIKSESTISFSAPKKQVLPAAIGHPVQMCSSAVEEFVPGRDKHIEDLYIDVDMKVSDQGKPYDISLNGNAPRKLLGYLRRVLEKSRYRPAIDRQGDVNEGDLTFRQVFDPGESRQALSATDVATWTSMKTTYACNWMALND